MNRKNAFQEIGGPEQFQNVPNRTVGYYPKHYKAFTCLTSQSYATSNEESNEDEKKDGLNKSEEDAKNIREIILKGDLKQLDGEELLEKNALAKELFKTGILMKEISPCQLQQRFRQSCQEDKIIFFPTGLTTNIFKIILETKGGNPFYLTSQKGIGKSFSVALLVVLLRRDPSKRVFYLNNSEGFCGFPDYYFLKELERSFYEELQDNNMELDKELKKIFNLQIEEVLSAVKILLIKIGVALDKKSKKLFIIIDQVNSLEKPRETALDKLAFSLYKLLKAFSITETTRVFVCSTTNEGPTITPSQEYPLIILEPVHPTTEEAIKFVSIRSEGHIKDKDEINKILEFTDRHLLMINEVLIFSNEKDLNERLREYQLRKLPKITADLRKFFQPNEYVRQDLVDRRKVAMTTVLYTLLNKEENSTVKPKLSKSFEEQEIDARYFIYDTGKLTIEAINHLAISGLREILDDLNSLKEAIPHLSGNPGGLGKLFEDLIFKYLPRCKITQAYPLIPFLDDGKDAKREIDFSKFEYHKFKTQEMFDFSTSSMLRVPDIPTFAAFDGFLVTHTDVFALQVKKRGEKQKLEPLIASLKQAAEKERPTEESEKAAEEEKSTEEDKDKLKNNILNNIQRAIKAAKEANKTLCILLISISQDPTNDTALEDFRQKLPLKCYYLDARQALINLGFENSIKLIEPSSIPESAGKKVKSEKGSKRSKAKAEGKMEEKGSQSAEILQKDKI